MTNKNDRARDFCIANCSCFDVPYSYMRPPATCVSFPSLPPTAMAKESEAFNKVVGGRNSRARGYKL